MKKKHKEQKSKLTIWTGQFIDIDISFLFLEDLFNSKKETTQPCMF